MATTVTSILRDGVTASGVYPTFAAWFATLPASLVSADEVHILNVEAKAGGYTGVTLDLTGITTDATHYVKIQAASGHRHAGVFDTSKAMFKLPAANTAPWLLATNFLYLDGLQIDHSGITGSASSLTIQGQTSATNKIQITGCIFTGTGSGGSALFNTIKVYEGASGYAKLYLGSNIFQDIQNTSYPNSTGVACVRLEYGQVYAYGNTFANCSSGFSGGNATYQFLLKNNLVAGKQFSAGRTDYQIGAGGLATGSTNNLSSDATATGANAQINKTVAFVSATDYHLAGSDTSALGLGVNLSADGTFPVTTDIDATTISTPYSIGADSASAVVNTLTVTGPATGTIYQHIGGVQSFTVTGTYTGTLTAIKARIVQFGTNTPISGFDWATVVASPTGNAFSFAFTDAPKGAGWYGVQVQDTVDSSINAVGGKVGIGEYVCIAGQSNGNRFLTVGSGTVSDLVRAFGNGYTGWQVPTGAGPAAFGAAFATAYGCPVGLINTAVDGTSIAQWAGGTFTAAKAIIDSVGGKIASMIFVQGEMDWNGTTYATYLSGLGTVLDTNFRGQLGIAALPVFIVALGAYPAGTGTDTTTYDQVKRAQYDYASGHANTYIVDRIDCTLVDGLHLDGPGAAKLGDRLVQALQYQKGQAAQYRGPSIASVNKINATNFNVVVTHHLGSDLTPATEITGFKAIDPGASNAAIAVTSALRISSNTIRLVLASAPVGLPVISYAAGSLPNITAMARDNSVLMLPVEWEEGITAVVATANGVFVKVAGAYIPATGVFAKVAGAYKAADSIYYKDSGIYEVL